MKIRILSILLFTVQIAFGQIYIDSYRFAGAGPTLPNIVTDNLLAWYDASVSTSYPGSGSTWNDLTPNGYDLTIQGATYSSSNNGVFDFDGSNDRMIYNSSNINQEVRTASIWLNSDIRFDGSSATRQGVLYCLGNSSDQFDFVLGSFVNANAYVSATRTVIGIGLYGNEIRSGTGVASTWYNITVTYNSSTAFDFFVNGVQITDYTISGNNGPVNINNIIIGARNSSNYFNGKIGEVQLYSDQLTASEVLQNYNATKTRYGY